MSVREDMNTLVEMCSDAYLFLHVRSLFEQLETLSDSRAQEAVRGLAEVARICALTKKRALSAG